MIRNPALCNRCRQPLPVGGRWGGPPMYCLRCARVLHAVQNNLNQKQTSHPEKLA